MFSVTTRAGEEILAIAQRLGHTQPILRVSISSGGCSGFQYHFEMVSEWASDDVVVTSGDAKVVVDPTSLEFMNGATLDWHDSLMGSHFKMLNPQATSGCGCGVSFSV